MEVELQGQGQGTWTMFQTGTEILAGQLQMKQLTKLLTMLTAFKFLQMLQKDTATSIYHKFQ